MKRIQLFLMLCTVLVASVTQAATEKTTYFHNDALGSPIAATDGTGKLLWTESYKPYGERLEKIDGNETGLFYTGKQEEKDIGLSYFGARWYDPVAGRFTGVDPVGFNPGNVHSFNRYAYANNNPYAFVDPDGRSSEHIDAYLIEKLEAEANGFDLSTWKGTDEVLRLGVRNARMQVEAMALMVGGVEALAFKAALKTSAKTLIDLKRLKHIFRSKEGHLSADTLKNRKLLEGVANKRSTTLGTDKHGNTWSAQTRSDGSQVWTQARGGRIINGGVNKTPKQFNPETGLSSPD